MRGILHLRMKHRRFLFVGELLAIWFFLRPKLLTYLAFVSLIVWDILRPDRIKLCSRFASGGSSIHPFVSFKQLSPKDLFHAIPLRARLLSRHSNNRPACARRRYRCLFSFASRHRSISKWNGEGCFIRDVQLCSMCFVMAVNDVITHDPRVFTVFFFEMESFFFFIQLRVSLGEHFAMWC